MYLRFLVMPLNLITPHIQVMIIYLLVVAALVLLIQQVTDLVRLQELVDQAEEELVQVNQVTLHTQYQIMKLLVMVLLILEVVAVVQDNLEIIQDLLLVQEVVVLL